MKVRVITNDQGDKFMVIKLMRNPQLILIRAGYEW